MATWLIIFIIPLIVTYAIWEILRPVYFVKPGGAYSVGTVSLEITDISRIEDSLTGENRYRRLILQFWYPTEKTTGLKKAKYHPNPDVFNADVASLFSTIPQSLLKKLSGSTTNSFTNAPLSAFEKEFPVLVFSHGLDAMRSFNTYQMEECASHGYIVVSIEHTFAAAGTVFSDGSKGGVIRYELMEDENYANEMVNKWTADQVFTIDCLEKINNDPKSFFYGRLNMKELGVMGFSFGGAVSANTLVFDKRIKAGVNLDGFYYGDNHTKGFEQPYMEIRSQPAAPDKVTEAELKMSHLTRARWKYIWFEEWEKRLNAYVKNKADFFSYTVKGANHFSFSDMPLMAPFIWLLSPKTRRIHKITNQYALAFFNQQLKGIESSLLDDQKKLLK